MKKNLLVLLCSALCLGAVTVKAQTYTFAFSQFYSAYVPLSGGTNVYGALPWTSGDIARIPFGFSFNYQGFNEDSVDMIPGIFAFPPYDNMGMYAYTASLTDTGSSVSKSPVTYSTTGTVGNRILKVQCSDAGFDGEYNAYSTYVSAVNFQTWFYEADNSIEVRVGTCNVVNPLACYLDSANPGPAIGIIQYDQTQTTILYSLALSGSPVGPTQTTYISQAYPPITLNTTPTSGTVYRFAQLVSGINENDQVIGNVGMFPNPANENSTLVYSVKNSGNVNVIIADVQGRVVSNKEMGNQAVGLYHYDLGTQNLSSGIYYVTLVAGEQRIVQKLSVAH